MYEIFTNLFYYLRDLAHPIGFSFIAIGSCLVYMSGYRLAALFIGIPSVFIVVTSVMAWATTNPEPVRETLPNGASVMYFEQSIWEKIQYPVYIWATLIVSLAFIIFSLQLYLQVKRNRVMTGV